MHTKKIPGVVLAGSLLLAGCGGGGTISPSSSIGEDCDSEDFRNMEDECGFTKADRDRAKKKKLKLKSSDFKPIKKTSTKH